MIIFRISNDDITNNVEILCPTNHYSKQLFNLKSKTIFIVENNGFFEPIMLFKRGSQNIKIKNYSFSLESKLISEELKTTIKNILNYTLYCRPEFDKNYKNIYTFKNNVNSQVIIDKLREKKIKINKQLLNFNNQVVGLEIVYKNMNVFIPTSPSNITDPDSIDIVLLSDYINIILMWIQEIA